jgi:hypothetical protein
MFRGLTGGCSIARAFAVIRHVALDILFRSVDYVRRRSGRDDELSRTRIHEPQAALSSALDFFASVLIAFAEKQIPHELAVVDMAARRHREQPYLSLNPYGRVPTLEEDGFVLFESTAILNYLEATRPTPPLVPADDQS